MTAEVMSILCSESASQPCFQTLGLSKPWLSMDMMPLPNFDQSLASAKSSVAVISIAFVIRRIDTIPGFCAPRSMLLRYDRSMAAICASSSWEIPRSLRAARIATPSATSAGSFACRGEAIGIREWLPYDANHTTDDLPHLFRARALVVDA